jgi:hypothetical protein
MMHLAFAKLQDEGYELRLDACGYLNNSLKAILLRDKNISLAVAKEADDMATSLMRETDFDDAKVALLACSYFVLKLVEEGIHPDKTSQSVLVALMITADANEDENPDLHNLIPLAQEKAGKMLSRALDRGMYNMVSINL